MISKLVVDGKQYIIILSNLPPFFTMLRTTDTNNPDTIIIYDQDDIPITEDKEDDLPLWVQLLRDLEEEGDDE